ncbi:MAG TPA: Holliday junction branch migration protein RuvA [Bacteroidetes bacterium]|nr:Holliday junction branch migration protein RuvA [Bacteroidota bacterium]
MIVSLNGILAEKHPHRIVVDVSGVGYEIGISTQAYSALPNTGETTFLHIYHHITEAEQRLFGFINRNDKSLFEMLITVKGIGPKLALTIMSGMITDDLVRAISSQDTAMLSRTPGIGKKTAERLVLELRDKIGTAGTQTSGSTGSVTISGPEQEAISALEALGFKRIDAEKAVKQSISSATTKPETGELVRSALQLLYR